MIPQVTIPQATRITSRTYVPVRDFSLAEFLKRVFSALRDGFSDFLSKFDASNAQRDEDAGKLIAAAQRHTEQNDEQNQHLKELIAKLSAWAASIDRRLDKLEDELDDKLDCSGLYLSIDGEMDGLPAAIAGVYTNRLIPREPEEA